MFFESGSGEAHVSPIQSTIPNLTRLLLHALVSAAIHSHEFVLKRNACVETGYVLIGACLASRQVDENLCRTHPRGSYRHLLRRLPSPRVVVKIGVMDKFPESVYDGEKGEYYQSLTHPLRQAPTRLLNVTTRLGMILRLRICPICAI